MPIKYITEVHHPKNNCRLFKVQFDGSDTLAEEALILMEDKRLPPLLKEHPVTGPQIVVCQRGYKVLNRTTFEFEIIYGYSDTRSILVVEADGSVREFYNGATNGPGRIKTLIRKMFGFLRF